ncbi:hypothetical protein D7027_10070 [Ochrobactrum intermedium]|uniref:hypothetical protein n=1 Tax=Brucella intermedia TaxID=94625 RepID=UPI000FDEE068|nr:hypothetical protein [Brucella intermedia]MPR62152.1 hypothetical protein [Brucella intermedia]
MASEDLLKKAVAAFNALSPEQQAEMLEEQRQSWVRGNVGLSRDERGMTSPVMPRPAPAVTDTGLVTAKVEHRVHFGEDGNPTEWREGYGMGLYPQEPIVRVEVREYVTRSQAEELLAAERAKYRDAMEKLVESQCETLVWQQRAINLKSDNAAKDKLLKEAFHV